MPKWRKMLGLSECKKKIKYQTRSVKASVSSEFFSIKDFETNVSTIEKPTELAKILDEYQFDRCKDAEKSESEGKMEYYQKKRDIAIDLLTSLRTIIAIDKNDEDNLQKDLKSNIKDVRDFLRWTYLEEKKAKMKALTDVNLTLQPTRLKTKKGL